MLPGETHKVYKESEIKTILFCSKLYSLGGSANNFDISQKFLRYAFDLFILKLLKTNVRSVDNIINICVNKSFTKFYSFQTLNESQTVSLRSYAYTFIHNFIQKFSLKDYDILLGPTRPIMMLNDIKVELTIDAILKPKNKKRHLHAICFYPYIDSHLKNDFSITLKAMYLKKFASSSINKKKFSEVNIHLVSNTKAKMYLKHQDRRFLIKSLKYNEINLHLPKSINEETLTSLSKINSPKPICPFVKCTKRKECFDEPR